MLKRIKQEVLHQAKWMGLFQLVGNSRWRDSRLLILCYHGISLMDEHVWDPALFMAPETFRRRMALLREHGCSVLPLDQGLSLFRAGELPPRAVSITFDDGNYDFLARAYPILQEYGLPATVYLTTYYSGDQRPVFDPVCSYILWKGRGRRFEGKEFVGEAGVLSLETDSSRLAVFRRIYSYVREAGLSADEKDRLASCLADRLEVDYQQICSRRILHLMTPMEVGQLSPSVDVQLHTHRHRTPRDRDLFLREIRDNRVQIAAARPTSKSPVHFCYPSGDHDLQFLPWLRELDVVSATTCEPGIVTRDSNPLLLPRVIDTSNLSTIEFEGWLSGMSAWLPKRRA